MDDLTTSADNLFRSRVMLWLNDARKLHSGNASDDARLHTAYDALQTLLEHPEQLRQLQARLMLCPASQRICPSYLLKDWFSYFTALLRCHDQLQTSQIFRRFRVNRYEMLGKLQNWVEQYEQLSTLCDIDANTHLKLWPAFIEHFHVRKLIKYLSAFWVQWHGLSVGEARKLLETLGLKTKANAAELSSLQLPWPPGFEPLFTFPNTPLSEQDLAGTKAGRVLMFYQPVYDNATGQLHHCESLIRYNLANRMQLPEEFFLSSREPVRWALSGIQELGKRLAHLDFAVAINVRCEDLLNVKVRQQLRQTLAQSTTPTQVILELECAQVVETGLQLLPVLGTFADEGCRFSLDNCGVGPLPSNEVLAYFSVMKLHPYLLHDCHEDLAARLIMDELISYAQSHGLLITAKHVDSAAMDQRQRALNFNLAQGFYLGEPALNPPKQNTARPALQAG